MTDRPFPRATTFEDELLLCCAQVSPGSETRARLGQLAARPLDWETVLNRSWWHRIRPLTYRHLISQPPGTVPDSVLAELAGHVSELRERNQRLSRVLANVADYFEAAGLRGLVFKGPTLSEDAYGDLSLRECGDLDLLVDRNDFGRIAEVLTAQGFESWWERDDRNQQLFACEFERSDGTLDVHWELSPAWLNYRVNFARLWETATPLSPDRPGLRKLSPEDTLVVLCIHGAKHWWERLRWISDVAELINRDRVKQWDRVEAAAFDARCWRSVALGLWLAGNLLSARVPSEVMRRLEATPGITRLGQQVRVWLGYAEQSPEMRTTRDRFFFRMGLCERRRDRVSQLVRYLAARPRHAK